MVHSFLKNNWLFFAAVGVVLAGASLWSRFTGELTSDGVASLVKDRIENPDLSVLSVRPENRDDRVASVRLFGKASTLWFHRSTGEWIWTEIEADEGKSRQSAGKYMDSLRSENEEAAANTLRLINTAQVAAHIRNGRFQTISDLRSSAFLLIDLTHILCAGIALKRKQTVRDTRSTPYLLRILVPGCGRFTRTRPCC